MLLGSGGGAAPVLGHAALQVPQLLLLLARLGLERRDLVRCQGHQQGRRLPQVHVCSAAAVGVIAGVWMCGWSVLHRLALQGRATAHSVGYRSSVVSCSGRDVLALLPPLADRERRALPCEHEGPRHSGSVLSPTLLHACMHAWNMDHACCRCANDSQV